jgi:hypothetical protein
VYPLWLTRSDPGPTHVSEFSDRSFQQLDPVSVFATRPLTILFSVCLLVYAAIETALGWVAIVHPILTVFAFAALALAAAGGIHFSSERRAPFPRAAYIVIVLLVVAAMAFDAGASWEGAAVPPGEWGPVSVGLVLLQLAHYRPAREIAIATVFGGFSAGLIVVLHPMSVAGQQPELVVIVETVIPLVALGLGASAYAAALNRSLSWVRTRSDQAARTASDALREHIVRSVQLERVGILNQQVIPFFSEIMRRDHITPADMQRAADISESVRRMMVAEVDRTWLDTLVDQLAEEGGSGSVGSESIQDPQHLASIMSTEQRIIMRVLIVTLVAQPGFDPDGFAVLLVKDGSRCEVTVNSLFEREESGQRSGLGAYIAVLRIVFDDLRVSMDSKTLTLRFAYEHN